MLKIGVFDSGVGGLSVLRDLIKEFPTISWVYLGDTARLPYGSKSPEIIRQYTIQNLKFLEKYNCDAFIIACNSASAQFQDPAFNNIPVFNVIKPGSIAATKATKNKTIGIIGTKATITSQIYEKKLNELDTEITTVSVACPLFVPFVEEGLWSGNLINQVIEMYLTPLKNHNIDTLVLGCTHYPLLSESISLFLKSQVKLISSSQELIPIIRSHFPNRITEGDNINSTKNISHTDLNSKIADSTDSAIKILTTDNFENVKSLAIQILNTQKLIQFETVDITNLNSKNAQH